MTEAPARRSLAGASGRALPWLGSLAIGLLLGGLSLFGDAVGIRVLNGLANAAGPWLLAAFAAGLLQRELRFGALAGVAGLLVAVVTYYLGMGIVFGPDRTYAGPLIVLWLVAAAVGGAVLGGAGSIWATGTGRWRAIAGALPIAALFAEAAHRFVQLDPSTGIDPSSTYAQVMLAEALAGGLLVWILVRAEGNDRRTGYLAAAGLSIAGLAVFLAVDNLASTLAFP